MRPGAGGHIGNGDHTYYCGHCGKTTVSISAPWPPTLCPHCGHILEKLKQ